MAEPVTLIDFVRESNRIENIHRDPTPNEVHAHKRFLEAPEISVQLLEDFVAAIEPGAILRRKVGLNVRVWKHIAPPGGPGIEINLKDILSAVNYHSHSAHSIHLAYEELHPFTDGNGRSGRVLWLWMLGGVVTPELFLHKFYYQTLEES